MPRSVTEWMVGEPGTFHGIRQMLLTTTGWKDVTIERNRIYDCVKGIAVGNPKAPDSNCGTAPWHGVGGVIRSNFIRRYDGRDANHIGIELCHVKDLLVANNTVYSENAAYFRTISLLDGEGSRLSGVRLVNNLIRGRIKDFTPGGGWTQVRNVLDEDGSQISASWFADAAQGDFHLSQEGRSAIAAGTALGDLLGDDFDGEERPADPALGADQP